MIRTRADPEPDNGDHHPPQVAASTALPATFGDDALPARRNACTPLPARTIALVVLASFGASMATVVPMAYSLTARLDALAPGRADLLGIILGIGAAATLVASPITGILSDRTRSRWGRRRPFTALGVILGCCAVPVMSLTPSVFGLGVGWAISTVGWSTALASVGNYQADQLAPDQRGKVTGVTTLASHLAPVLGIVLVGMAGQQIVFVFTIPALIGLALTAIFIVGAHEEDSRAAESPGRLQVRTLLASYWFRPSRVPDFAWNWLGRFCFFSGLILTTSFITFFYSQRLGVPVTEVVNFLALTSALSLVTTSVGALGTGWLSDRWGRRRPFIAIAAVVFTFGCVVLSLADTVAMLLVGAALNSLGIAAFASTSQAIVLDVLPSRDTDAGRYMGINAFSQKVPGAAAPLIAPLIVGTAGGQNYFALYLIAAALVLLGGLIITWRVRGIP